MKPKWQILASLAQEICTLSFQFFGAVFASKGYPFKNILFLRPGLLMNTWERPFVPHYFRTGQAVFHHKDFSSFPYINMGKTGPTPGSHVFKWIKTM